MEIETEIIYVNTDSYRCELLLVSPRAVESLTPARVISVSRVWWGGRLLEQDSEARLLFCCPRTELRALST